MGRALQARIGARPVVVAFNEFCAPSPAQAIDELVAGGARRITVLTTMITRGGGHSEIDIPEAVAAARERHPRVAIEYAWPFDLDKIAEMLARHVPAE